MPTLPLIIGQIGLSRVDSDQVALYDQSDQGLLFMPFGILISQ